MPQFPLASQHTHIMTITQDETQQSAVSSPYSNARGKGIYKRWKNRRDINFKESLSVQFLWCILWYIADDGLDANIGILFCPAVRMT